MSGRVSLDPPGEERSRTPTSWSGSTTALSCGWSTRGTFGFSAVYTDEELAGSPLRLLGADAWEEPLTTSELGARLAGRTAPIKPLLLDQRIVAGLGNIYADEALFRARIHPIREGGSLTPAEVARLRRAVKVTLDAGLRWGGTTLDDRGFLSPDGRGRRLRPAAHGLRQDRVALPPLRHPDRAHRAAGAGYPLLPGVPRVRTNPGLLTLQPPGCGGGLPGGPDHGTNRGRESQGCDSTPGMLGRPCCSRHCPSSASSRSPAVPGWSSTRGSTSSSAPTAPASPTSSTPSPG